MLTCCLRAGYTPIVTCATTDNELCESYGAAACFDHSSPNCGADVRVYTEDKLKYVLDTVTEPATQKMCYTAIGETGGSYIALDAISVAEKYTRRDVRADWLLPDIIFGQGSAQEGTYGRAPSPEHRVFGKELFALAEHWLKNSSIKTHPLKVQDGGLATIPTALEGLKSGEVQGQKLVLPISAH